MIVSPWWLLVAFLVGGTLGFFFCALLALAARQPPRAPIGDRWNARR